MDTSTMKEKLGRFGRAFTLLLNRALMYQKNHPFVRESAREVQQVAESLLESISPLVFILNRDQFYVDEEPLDPRINTKRIATIFKNSSIQSISFEEGMSEIELDYFIENFAGLTAASDAESLKDKLSGRGVFNIKINHVLFKKVSEDDQIVSREALKKVTPMVDENEEQNRKRFMETLLESVLADEFAQTLNIGSLLRNPALVSRNIIQADLNQSHQSGNHDFLAAAEGDGSKQAFQPAETTDPGRGFGYEPGQVAPMGAGASEIMSAGQGGAGSRAISGSGSGAGNPAAGQVAEASPPGAGTAEQAAAQADSGTHGPMILHQLNFMHSEVEKHLQGKGEVPLNELAQAVFDMKRQLMEGISAQKALGVAFANESAIMEKAEAITDQVLIELVRQEYQAGKIATARLAMIIRRLLPNATDLKRLLPRIKLVLLKEGMPVSEYLNLINELKNEFKGEELARILQESSEAIGVDGDELIEELKRNPGQAAEMIYLASEIRKGTGDESALADIMVEYVEKFGNRMAVDSIDDPAGQAHLKTFLAEIESTLLRQLGRTNASADVMGRIEERLNARLDSALDKIRVEWLKTQSAGQDKAKTTILSVIQTLEYNVGEDEELAGIIKRVRTKVDDGEIGANDFSRIHAEIVRQKKLLHSRAETDLPDGVLTSDEFIFILEKEIARVRRYDAEFSALAFSMVSAKPQITDSEQVVTSEAVMCAALNLLAQTFREVDFIGQIGKNKIVVLLPMVGPANGRKALNRVMRVLHANPLKVGSVPVQVRIAGVMASCNGEQELTAKVFSKQLSNQLIDMAARLKNIQGLM